MYELKITAHTMTELRERVTELALDMGVTISQEYEVRLTAPVEVPLPEPRVETEEKPKRKTKAEKAAEAQPVKKTAEIEHVDADVVETGREVDKSHASPGEVYTLKGDVYNNDNRRLTYKDGVRFSSVHKDSEGKFTEYAEHAPEVKADGVGTDDGIPEHMRDDVAPASVEEAREELVSIPDELDGRPTSAEAPTETESAPPVEPEPDTSEPVTDASQDGAETSDSGPSAEADESFPSEFAAFIDEVESAKTWDDVKASIRTFYQTQTFKEMSPERQNKVRANTAMVCTERREEGLLNGLPDQADDLSFFRLWLEAQYDRDAIEGTYFTLKTGGQWKAANDAMKGAIDNAVKAKLEALL